MLKPQEGKRLDAKRHYVILAKALDGIWPVGHACAVLCCWHQVFCLTPLILWGEGGTGTSPLGQGLRAAWPIRGQKFQ